MEFVLLGLLLLSFPIIAIVALVKAINASDRLRGMEISIVTTAKTDEEGLKLLQLLGMPFQAS